MLSRNIRFIFLYSDMHRIVGDGLAPWYGIAKQHTLLKKPFRREHFWAAMLGEHSPQPNPLQTPLSPQWSPKKPQSSDPHLNSSPAPVPPRILLVEDDRINVAVAKRYIAWAGYEDVATAHNGVEAVTMVRQTLRHGPGSMKHMHGAPVST
jgi:hypothetical protein